MKIIRKILGSEVCRSKADTVSMTSLVCFFSLVLLLRMLTEKSI